MYVKWKMAGFAIKRFDETIEVKFSFYKTLEFKTIKVSWFLQIKLSFCFQLIKKHKRNHKSNHISQMFEDNVFFFFFCFFLFFFYCNTGGRTKRKLPNNKKALNQQSDEILVS